MQKFMVALAAMVVALTTVIGGTYGLVALVRDDDGSGGSVEGSGKTPESSPTSFSAGEDVVVQGSPEADQLVHALLENDDGRVSLDAFVLAREDSDDRYELHLWYNCDGQAPGPDHCSDATLSLSDVDRGAATYENPTRFRLKGVFTVTLVEGDGFGTDVSLQVEKVVT